MRIIVEDKKYNEIIQMERSFDFQDGEFYLREEIDPRTHNIVIKLDSEDLRKLLNRYFDYVK